ncbi:MAG: aminotransferase class V-fold PLP-dependent enzyme [Rhodobacteraceae bacterium]|nr:aminotransferase class V-fold PLP-dependent enzyme [Paracoccaceae bacterium]
MPLSKFRKTLTSPTLIDDLRKGLIGEGMMIGDVPLIYADYVASGRALRQVEDFVTDHVLPYYANTHTEDSFCGRYAGQLREQARAEIARLTQAGPDCSVIFAGSGATAGLNRLVSLLGVEQAQNPVVFIGPYEHHSNILPWRESNAQVIEIPECPSGGPDLAVLEQALQDHAGADLKIGSFSAASNVTGVITDSTKVSRLLKKHGALAIWDYAGAGPYLDIDMASGTDAEKDAVVLSPHKFPGGPGASGLLILRESVVKRDTPTWPGGGTVAFVSPWAHEYLDDIVAREEAGTPNIIGDIRAALVFIIKDMIGQDVISTREYELNAMAIKGWFDNPHLTLLGVENDHRLPIFSFLVQDAAGNNIHYADFTRKLSDQYGIQSRGGCACAGPYGHRLLEVDKPHSEALHRQLTAGNLHAKPGWIRLNFSYLMSDETAQYIINGVNTLTKELSGKARVAS